jgi:hypothetical protein
MIVTGREFIKVRSILIQGKELMLIMEHDSEAIRTLRVLQHPCHLVKIHVTLFRTSRGVQSFNPCGTMLHLREIKPKVYIGLRTSDTTPRSAI